MVELVLDSVDVVLHSLFKLVDTDDGEDVAETDEDKAKTEQPGEGDAGRVEVVETEDAQHSASDTEEHENPPVLEAVFLVVKALDELHDAFEHNPNGEDDRQ